MRRSHYIIGLLCWLIIGWEGNAQPTELRFERIGMEEGLPNMTIQALYQDQSGFVWIGTWDGLSRYDGYHFSNYHYHPFDTTTINANDIKAIGEDRNGRLLFGTEEGLNLYDPHSDSFQRFLRNIEDSTSFWGKRVSGIALDTMGISWIGNSLGSGMVNKFFPDNLTFRNIPAGYFNCLMTMGDYIWAGGNKGLQLIDAVTDSVEEISSKYPELSEIKGVLSLLADRKGLIWIGTTNGLYRFHPRTSELRKYDQEDGLSDFIAISLCEDHTGEIWIGTRKGLNRLSEDREEIVSFQHNSDDPYSLSHDVIISLMEDRSGNLWVGTYKGGVNKVNLKVKLDFNAYGFTHFDVLENQLTVFSFAEGKDNRLWVGTNNGIYLLDKTTKDIQYHISFGKAENQLIADTPFVLHETHDGYLLIGTASSGLNVWDIHRQNMEHYPRGKNGLTTPMQRTIDPIPNKPGEYWISGNYLHLFDLKKRKFEYLTDSKKKPDYTKLKYNYKVLPVDDCNLWTVGNAGLMHVDLCKDEIENYLLGDPKVLINPTLIDLLPDGRDGFWLGGYGTGLFHLTLPSRKVKHYGLEQGLPNNFVYGILMDHLGNLWMSTNNGLAKFNPQTEVMTPFGLEDGLVSWEHATGSSMMASDGEMYFGGNNGFVSFYPEKIVDQASTFDPPVYITSINVSGSPIETDRAIYTVDTIRFPAYRGQHLELNFVSLDYSRPNHNRFQYMLEGVEPEWSKPSLTHQVQYSHLDPGVYTFKVKGTNGDGIFSGKEKTLTIIIEALWHQTTWFRWGAPIIALLLIIFLTYRYVHRLRVRERIQLQLRIAQVRQEALASQMDQHFTFNSLNSIQRYVGENDTESAMYYISRFGKLIRRVLNQAQENFLPISEEFETLKLYLSLEAMRTKNRFEYRFQIDPELDIYNTEIPTGLLQPYIENAIWHGMIPKKEKGRILISASMEKDQLMISVEDNGIGRKRAQELKDQSKLKHNSKGMQITRDRVETLNTLYDAGIEIKLIDLEELHGKSLGTRVEIWLKSDRD